MRRKKKLNEVECEYKCRCTSYPDWCQTCVNNRGKRNHYKPDPQPQPYWPWYPWYPHYPWYEHPYIWYTYKTESNSEQKDYYTGNVNNTC